MKRNIFCLIILIWLIPSLHCKHYLVEVDNDGPDKSNLDKAVTPAGQEKDEIDVEDINETNDDGTDGINIDLFQT